MSKKNLSFSAEVIMLINEKEKLQSMCRNADGNERRELNRKIKVLKAKIQQEKQRTANTGKIVSFDTNTTSNEYRPMKLKAIYMSGSF